jgi:hypothetical protein
MIVRNILLGAGTAFITVQTGSAQNLLPAKPDVVLECYQANAPTSACRFSCWNPFPSPGQTTHPPNTPPESEGNGLTFMYSSRVEMYSKGYPGRTDQRVWVAVRSSTQPGPNPKLQRTVFLSLASTMTCSWEGPETGAPLNIPAVPEWRITQFNQ